jgi:hypothetical protein
MNDIAYIQRYYGTFPWVKWPEREDDHSSHFSGGMKNTLNSASTLPHMFIMGGLVIGKIVFFPCDTNVSIFLSH